MNKDKRYEIFSRLRAENPNPVTELEYSSPFELLIAVLFSAQATDVSVNKATRKLFPVANTPEKMLALGVDGLKATSKPLAYLTLRPKMPSRLAKSSSKSTTASSLRLVKSSRRCQVLAAKPPMWSLTPLFAKSPWPSILTFFVLAIVPRWRQAKTS